MFAAEILHIVLDRIGIGDICSCWRVTHPASRRVAAAEGRIWEVLGSLSERQPSDSGGGRGVFRDTLCEIPHWGPTEVHKSELDLIHKVRIDDKSVAKLSPVSANDRVGGRVIR